MQLKTVNVPLVSRLMEFEACGNQADDGTLLHIFSEIEAYLEGSRIWRNKHVGRQQGIVLPRADGKPMRGLVVASSRSIVMSYPEQF